MILSFRLEGEGEGWDGVGRVGKWVDEVGILLIILLVMVREGRGGKEVEGVREV